MLDTTRMILEYVERLSTWELKMRDMIDARGNMRNEGSADFREERREDSGEW